MDKSASVRVEIRSRKAKKIIDKTLKAADRPGKAQLWSSFSFLFFRNFIFHIHISDSVFLHFQHERPNKTSHKYNVVYFKYVVLNW